MVQIRLKNVTILIDVTTRIRSTVKQKPTIMDNKICGGREKRQIQPSVTLLLVTIL